MNLLGRLLFLIGLAAVLIGGFDVSLLLRGTRSPEVVTITELGADDGTRNVHLTVTDFQFGDGFVLEEEEGVCEELSVGRSAWSHCPRARRPVPVAVRGLSGGDCGCDHVVFWARDAVWVYWGDVFGGGCDGDGGTGSVSGVG